MVPDYLELFYENAKTVGYGRDNHGHFHGSFGPKQTVRHCH
jgi:hypothetical protein